MPIRGGKLYLLGESSEPHTTAMDPQLTATLPNKRTQLNTLTQTVNQAWETIIERLTNLEIAREQPTDEQPPLQPYTMCNNAPDPDEQYLKSIKLDVSTFDDHLDP